MIFLISLSLFRASSGVRPLISRPAISSRICERTGSSNWKKLNWRPSRAEAILSTFFWIVPFLSRSFSSCFRISSARLIRLRETGHFSNLDTERVVRTSFNQLAQKNNFVCDFFYRYIIVFYFFKRMLHFVQFVIMGGKERFGMIFRMFVQIFDDRPGNRNPVVSRSTSS